MVDSTVIQVYDAIRIFDILGPSGFLVLVLGFIAYQIYSPSFLPETKFQTIIEEFQKQIDGVEQKVTAELDEFGDKQLAHIQITRAIASVENPSEEIDDDVVDQYLIQNGIDKDDFLLTDEESKDHITKNDDR